MSARPGGNVSNMNMYLCPYHLHVQCTSMPREGIVDFTMTREKPCCCYCLFVFPVRLCVMFSHITGNLDQLITVNIIFIVKHDLF